MGEILRVEGISFSYARDPVWSDVSFSVGAGEVVFLVGRNGMGKSTLLKCLAGWLRPSSGRIRFAFDGVRGALAFVNDVPAFYDDLTAREHVLLLLRAGRMEGREEYAESLLDEFGLGRSLDRYPSTFSRGMRLKLALSLVLAIQPKLLLLDEPYGPLDAESSAILDREISQMAAAGLSTVVSCHAHSSSLSPRATLVLEDGRLDHV